MDTNKEENINNLSNNYNEPTLDDKNDLTKLASELSETQIDYILTKDLHLLIQKTKFEESKQDSKPEKNDDE